MPKGGNVLRYKYASDSSIRRDIFRPSLEMTDRVAGGITRLDFMSQKSFYQSRFFTPDPYSELRGEAVEEHD